MGYGRYEETTRSASEALYVTKSKEQIFTSRGLPDDMNPKGLKIREARDSLDNPHTVPIMIFLDVTGSMGRIPETMARKTLTNLFDILGKSSVEDPTVLFGAIGDHKADGAPLQVGQFESETTLLEHWLTSVYLEGGGGAQMRESYGLAYLIAGRHTATDAFEKRGERGFLFTIGDEAPWDTHHASFIKDCMGYKEAAELSTKELLEEAQVLYNVFHIHCQDGSYRNLPAIINPWRELLGENLLVVENSNDVAKIIATTVADVWGKVSV